MNDKITKALASRPSSAKYEVGYGKPPQETRFKQGISGNPKGRPKGARNKRPALHEERMKSIILEEAYRTIKVRDGERNVTVPIAQAVMRSLAVNAVKGNHRAQHLFADLLAETERSNRKLHDEYLETAIAYKCDWERELERRKALGITAPDPIPHPDDIIIDLKSGGVTIRGPMTKEEKQRWDRLRDKKREFEEELEELQRQLKRARNPESRAFLEQEIARDERTLEMIRTVIPE